jgi:transposase-like protein
MANKQVVKMGDKVYCPYCQDSYWVDDRVNSWLISEGLPQAKMRCSTCGRIFEFEVVLSDKDSEK